MTKQWKPGDRIECDMSFVAQQADIVEEGYIAGIASTPSLDLYGHKVMAGAFDASIRKKGLSGPRGIKLLAQHDWRKPAGVIKRLETIDDNLRIAAQLNLNVSYVRDLHEIAKQNGGLSFSVGFVLEEFDFVENDAGDDSLVIKRGDLMEVSVVTFPAQVEAEMEFVKHAPNTLTEFEKALVADGLCRSRGEARKLTLAVKNSLHLFHGKPPTGSESAASQPSSGLDVQLKACSDQIARFKAVLSSRRA
ncbi:HK97 family phage prohead protease [Bradyrhizobium neotropicale]|uniref:HK97 family phage prohead protease n=1 Tax=Bradyrhizobium neotropicale TaxID=1497615 RepID=UPI001AD72BDE|nr:HK97 family phage prohead protease [Bradyrhizobium neotropicale]MBO4228438.1 HK97 family phage prohead protease [Bradyrhizobium neotropicale]